MLFDFSRISAPLSLLRRWRGQTLHSAHGFQNLPSEPGKLGLPHVDERYQRRQVFLVQDGLDRPVRLDIITQC